MNSIARAEILVRLRAASHLDESDVGCGWFGAIEVDASVGDSDLCLDDCCSDVRIRKLALAASQAAADLVLYFTEFAGTIFTLSITIRFVGLLISPCALRSTDVSPIFSSTSTPLINLPNVVYWPSSR